MNSWDNLEKIGDHLWKNPLDPLGHDSLFFMYYNFLKHFTKTYLITITRLILHITYL